jgi:hypothetical protein
MRIMTRRRGYGSTKKWRRHTHKRDEKRSVVAKRNGSDRRASL